MKRQTLFSLLALTIGFAQLSANLEQEQKQTNFADLVEKYIIQPPYKVAKSVAEAIINHPVIVAPITSVALLSMLYNKNLYTKNDLFAIGYDAVMLSTLVFLPLHYMRKIKKQYSYIKPQ